MVLHAGNRLHINVGVDPWLGGGRFFKLSQGLRDKFSDIGLTVLVDYHLIGDLSEGRHKCFIAEELELSSENEVEWNRYVAKQKYREASLSDNEDSLVWSWNKSLGFPIAKIVCDSMFDQHVVTSSFWWHMFFVEK